MRNFNLLKSRTAAVVTGAVVIVGLGTTGATAAGLINSDDIRNNSIQSQDIRRNAIGSSELDWASVSARHLEPNSVGASELTNHVQSQLDDTTEIDGLQGQLDALSTQVQGNNGLPGDVTQLRTDVDALMGKQDVDALGALTTQNQNDAAARTTIQMIGGSIRTNHTPVTSINLEPGTYLVSAYGHFDRINQGTTGYAAPTTDTYGALALWVGDTFTSFDQGRGTYITGAISKAGFVEATASGSQIVTVTEPTTLNVSGFGYNEDRSGFGSNGFQGAGPQFSVFANISAVKVG